MKLIVPNYKWLHSNDSFICMQPLFAYFEAFEMNNFDILSFLPLMNCRLFFVPFTPLWGHRKTEHPTVKSSLKLFNHFQSRLWDSKWPGAWIACRRLLQGSVLSLERAGEIVVFKWGDMVWSQWFDLFTDLFTDSHATIVMHVAQGFALGIIFYL